MLAAPGVYVGMLAILTVILVQMAHRNLRQVERLWYGTGASDITLTPMWRYPDFDLWYYVREASWNRDYLLPMTGLVVALLLTTRHVFQRPARFLAIIFLATAWIQSLLLPVKAPRYAYHLTPLLILLWSAGLVAVARWLNQLALPSGDVVRRYGRIVVSVCGVAAIALACGLTVETTDLSSMHTAGYRIAHYKFANLEEPVKYLRDHLQDGDIIMSTAPHVVDHWLRLWGQPREGLDRDCWPQSRLHLQASLADHRDVPLHRLYGVVMASSLDGVEDLFGRHRRVWYVVDPTFNHVINDEEITAYLRQHMEVVHEDFSSLLMVSGEAHRPAFLRLADELSLTSGKAKYLP
jgi:hypothetical protein